MASKAKEKNGIYSHQISDIYRRIMMLIRLLPSSTLRQI
jgi:hypothetical protein